MSSMDYYVLDGHTPRIGTRDEHREMWLGGPDARRVAKTTIGDVEVSTVFLGFDHNWSDHGDPILFETMIFGGPHDSYQWRYRTWDEAEAHHKAVVKALSEGTEPE